MTKLAQAKTQLFVELVKEDGLTASEKGMLHALANDPDLKEFLEKIQTQAKMYSAAKQIVDNWLK